jgi:hypothetical protein
MTGPFTCGFGRYGIVAPLGGDCKEKKKKGTNMKINYELEADAGSAPQERQQPKIWQRCLASI